MYLLFKSLPDLLRGRGGNFVLLLVGLGCEGSIQLKIRRAKQIPVLDQSYSVNI